LYSPPRYVIPINNIMNHHEMANLPLLEIQIRLFKATAPEQKAIIGFEEHGDLVILIV